MTTTDPALPTEEGRCSNGCGREHEYRAGRCVCCGAALPTSEDGGGRAMEVEIEAFLRDAVGVRPFLAAADSRMLVRLLQPHLAALLSQARADGERDGYARGVKDGYSAGGQAARGSS